MGCSVRKIPVSAPAVCNRTFISRSRLMLTAIWLFLTGFTGYGQGEMTFDHITVEDGLTQSTVTAIFRDSRDFMWFGTYNGINLYDGVKIRQFE